MKKIILISLVILSGISLFPVDASAITTGIDQRCFEKQKCIDLRRDTGIDFGNQKPEDGFIQNTETTAACGVRAQGETGQEMGFCLPVGQTETMISFGGKRKFSDIGDFIRYMYKYSIMVAAIISTIMIIVAGFQWSASGGNSSTIQSAQKRIGNAIIGLTIAVLSYTILYWVNPNLVNFRLPQIWLINTIEIVHSPYCSEQPDGTMLAFAQKQDDKSVKAETLKERAAGPYNKDRFSGDCGANYFILNGGGQTCHGDSGTGAESGVNCNNETRICGPQNDKSGFDGCFEGDILIRAYKKPNGLFRSTEDWAAFPWIDKGEQELWAICANKDPVEVITKSNKNNLNEKDHLYQFSMSIAGGPMILKSFLQSNCGGYDPMNFKGFAFSVEMNESGDFTDEKHYFGTDGKGNAIDLGDEKVFKDLMPKIRPEFLIPLKAFVLQEKDKPERIGSKVRLKLNVNDVADIDNGTDWTNGSTGDAVRERFYAQYQMN